MNMDIYTICYIIGLTMRLLVNASNLSGGGGAQVADSICRYLKDYPQHYFVVVLSRALGQTACAIASYSNVEVVSYNYPSHDFKSLFTGRNAFLDGLVNKHSIDCVLTIFGPMKWRPRCPHVCGFGLSHIVMPESPYFKILKPFERIVVKSQIQLSKWIFKRSAETFYTENPLISERLAKMFKGKKVETITNNYNQIFDHPEEWVEKSLPPFDGIQLLDVTAFGPHKNVTIALDVAKILKEKHLDFKFRFVFTFEESQYPVIPPEYKENFLFVGKVSIDECPSLYQQCDIEFQPTLLECFTATYPEAMVMRKPIVTTDLEFARGLCGDAALYYDALSSESAADCIYRLANDKSLYSVLISNGIRTLKKYDSCFTRVMKILRLCECACK